MIVVFILTFIATSQITHVKAEAPKYNVDEAIEALHKVEYSEQDVINLIYLYSEKYGTDRHVIQQVIYHESHYRTYATGDYNNSFGVCQIFLPSHPEITKEMAKDPHFCIRFTIENIMKGQGRMWTGYRLCILNEHIVYEGKVLRCDKLAN